MIARPVGRAAEACMIAADRWAAVYRSENGAREFARYYHFRKVRPRGKVEHVRLGQDRTIENGTPDEARDVEIECFRHRANWSGQEAWDACAAG